MAQIPSGLVSHSRKVCNFYKRVLRHIDSTNHHIVDIRYQSVVIRAEFDKNKNIKDMRVANDILKKAEKKLYDDYLLAPKLFPNGPGGVAFEREHTPPDWVLDYWHPMEKSLYPKYFALREQRKKEYEEFYKKEYGQTTVSSGSSSHH